MANALPEFTYCFGGTHVLFVSNVNPGKQVKTRAESCHLHQLLFQVSKGHRSPGSPYLPVRLSCHPTGLSDPIHHGRDNLTEAIDWERVDECTPMSSVLQPLSLWLLQALCQQRMLGLVSALFSPAGELARQTVLTGICCSSYICPC